MPAPKPLIIPTILVKSRKEFAQRLRLMKGIAPILHVDAATNDLVPNKTWFNAAAVARMKSHVTFELHLMEKYPFNTAREWLHVPGFRRVLFHVESAVSLKDAIHAAHQAGLETGLAISPGTPLRKLLPHLKNIEFAVVMGGAPGFSGHPFDPKRLAVVRAIRAKAKHLPIGMDIGVSRKTIPTLVRAGVTLLYSGGAVFNAKNPRAELKALQRIATRTV